MWFDGQRQPNTIYVANTSRGKDSTAMLRAIQLLGFPLDMIVSIDIWATQDIPAELPPMAKFKDEYDRKVLEWFGIPVTRLCATKRSQVVQVERERDERPGRGVGCVTQTFSTQSQSEDSTEQSKDSPERQSSLGVRNSKWTRLTFEDIFYRQLTPKREREREAARQRLRENPNIRIPPSQRELVFGTQNLRTLGFPSQMCRWCTGELKKDASTASQYLRAATGVQDSNKPLIQPRNEGQKINIVHYLGIAADEPLRIAKHMPKKDKVLPLVQIGWDEALCGLEATYMDMLAPTYTDGKLRDGCWFCHNQSVDSLRSLRHDYPDLWALLMKWDNDSPVTYHPDGHTVHDFDKRFQMEDEGLIDTKAPFFWKMLDEERNYIIEDWR